MNVAIMQPYFLPYIGYFQLIQAVDAFVIYDNIQYTKKGWINRNRILSNGKPIYLTLPLQHDSSTLDICKRRLTADSANDAQAVIRRIRALYVRAPYFTQGFALLKQIYSCTDKNLFRFIHHSLQVVCDYLAIQTPLIVSSTISADHSQKAERRVLEICCALGADTYTNPIGGLELYTPGHFAARGVRLQFLKAEPIAYPQFEHEHVPWLSILDVLMFNPRDQVRHWLDRGYSIVEPVTA